MSENKQQLAKLDSWTVMQLDPDEIKDIVSEALGTSKLKVSDLSAIHMPTGGNTQFQLQTSAGEVNSPSYCGVIIHVKTISRKYDIPMGEEGASPIPDCWSDDGVTGHGKYAEACDGVCSRCPFSQFGSGKNGSRACKPHLLLFVLTPNSLLPSVVYLSSMSIKPYETYRNLLLGEGKAPSSVITEIALRVEKNSAKLDYSVATFSRIGDLSKEERMRFKTMGNEMGTYLKSSKVDVAIRDDGSINSAPIINSRPAPTPAAPVEGDEVIEAVVTEAPVVTPRTPRQPAHQPAPAPSPMEGVREISDEELDAMSMDDLPKMQ